MDEDFDCALPTRDGAAAAAAGGRTRGAAGRSLVVLRALVGASLGVSGAPRDLPCLGAGFRLGLGIELGLGLGLGLGALPCLQGLA